MNKYKVDAVPHLICGGFSKEDTENALIDLNFLGIENVLALRGDGDKTTGEFIPEPMGHSYGSELVDQIVCMNRGNTLTMSCWTPILPISASESPAIRKSILKPRT